MPSTRVTAPVKVFAFQRVSVPAPLTLYKLVPDSFAVTTLLTVPTLEKPKVKAPPVSVPAVARDLPVARRLPPARVTAVRPGWLLPSRSTVAPETSRVPPAARVVALARKSWPPEARVRPV